MQTPKRNKQPQFQWIPWQAPLECSEEQIPSLARLLSQEIRLRDRILLEGPMGAGKSTWSRALLEALGVVQPPEGSPSFAIAHEYDCPRGGVVHIDFYRLTTEDEIDEAGIPSYFWERDLIIITEWLNAWPRFETQVLKSGRTSGHSSGQIWRIRLSFLPEDPTRRRVTVEQLRP